MIIRDHRRGFLLTRSCIGLFALVLCLFAGCAKKGGQAVVLEKEYIAAMKSGEVTPAESQKTPDAADAKNEITVDQYVMKAGDRGTSRDPRALSHEQWIVKVRLIEGGRTFNLQADSSQWEKLKPGDRVRVAYQEGKYTGTIWDAEIR